jgi:peptidoglycan hydrolase-like protein with peptidoglycan-binding domain
MPLALLFQEDATQKGEEMKKRKSVARAIILSGAVGLLSTPAWSQVAPGKTRQPDPNLTRPGRDQDVPGVNQLSKNDIKTVQESLQAKGYKVGRVDGVADDDTRKAIRSFQQENGLPITGTVDQRTANKLGVKISKSGSSQQNRPSSGTSGQSGSDSRMEKPGDDQSLPSSPRN